MIDLGHPNLDQETAGLLSVSSAAKAVGQLIRAAFSYAYYRWSDLKVASFLVDENGSSYYYTLYTITSRAVQ